MPLNFLQVLKEGFLSSSVGRELSMQNRSVCSEIGYVVAKTSSIHRPRNECKTFGVVECGDYSMGAILTGSDRISNQDE